MGRSTRRAVLACVAAAMVLVACAMAPTAAYATSTGARDMYRLYNPNSGEHFYTASATERDGVVAAGWRYEGVGWTAPALSETPVYRLYSGTDHHYTTSVAERESLVKAGWKFEGVCWYSDDSQGVPLYRQYNPNVQPWAPRNNSGSHNYTASKAESDGLVRLGWRYEGVSWYGLEGHWTTATGAWDETVVDQDAWDEVVTVPEHSVLVADDGYQCDTEEEMAAHIEQIGLDHSYGVVDVPAHTETVRHDAVTHVVHHEAATHREWVPE